MVLRKSTASTNILILGLGGVGYYLAKRLAHEGYAITVIESEGGLIREADGNLDARLIQGNAMSIECWRDANAEKIDYLIAVTDNDAVNILASLLADRYGIPQKISRVRSLDVLKPDALLTALPCLLGGAGLILLPWLVLALLHRWRDSLSP